ncbi:ABC transporter ATP-binding protein [Helicovermis profundi]|uniref:ABC transporter ATP-binding protein n=1 Tax=Helicovermis profundi TaxID=3065157 RepID=A0AAU9E568_9FIRM|nr:ABC transporter ATP-binding protein [Clostridia bacterium S502]
MIKLKSYLKPFILMILITIGLVFIQAQMDLSLPGYLSDIVNSGIQSGGIEENIPKILAKEDMDKVLLFSNEKEKDIILRDYIYIGSKKDLVEKYIGEYSILSKNTNVYIIGEISESEDQILYNSISKKFNMVVGIKEKIDSGENISFGKITFPKGTDIFNIFKQMPDDKRILITKNIFSQMDKIDENIFSQMNLKAIKSYYDYLGVDTKKIQTSYILKIGSIMILITVIGALSSILVGFFASKVAAGVAKNLRRDLFSKILSFTNNEFDKFSTASLITRSTNDITQVQTILVMMIRMMFYAPLMGIGGVIKALNKSTSMSWIIALAVIVLLGFILVTFSIVMPRFKKIQKTLDKINLITREHLSGMMVIRAFNNQNFEEDRFDKTNRELTNLNLFVNRVMALLFPIMMFIMNGAMVLIIWVGAHNIANSAMQVGDMIAFMQYAMQIIMAFLMLSMLFIMVPRASVSATRIAEVIETKVSIKNPENPKKFPKTNGANIVFENVYFKYDGAKEYMLKDISFIAKKGETTAIIGSTGSGKTTLVNLITRFYDTSKGKITIKDRLITEVSQSDLRELIGYIPQKSMLFSGTVKSNLIYGNNNASEELINNSIRIAQATDFISEDELGIKKEISQGAQNISGGQKQRLSIARALVKDAEIYIFDDSFSALDYKTDASLRSDLREIVENKTVLIIAQRISTIKNADQIIVLDDGEIVGKGRHIELMKECLTYREIANSQLSKEEL